MDICEINMCDLRERYLWGTRGVFVSHQRGICELRERCL